MIHPERYMRKVSLYIPVRYEAEHVATFIVARQDFRVAPI